MKKTKSNSGVTVRFFGYHRLLSLWGLKGKVNTIWLITKQHSYQPLSDPLTIEWKDSFKFSNIISWFIFLGRILYGWASINIDLTQNTHFVISRYCLGKKLA